MTDLFEECRKASEFLNNGNRSKARDEVIKILDVCRKEKRKFTPLINHLIREVGLFPYIDDSTADWEDVLASKMFTAKIGIYEKSALHIEQAYILRELLKGESLAVSAPTSFGKSYIIDSYIAMSQPHCVVIIVPTVALADESRRRLARKFSSRYNIITTADQPLGEYNILVFPQERAFSYINEIKDIDILIVDEFYKAGLPDDRASKLLTIMVEFGKIAKQKYYIGPNIDHIAPNPFTQGLTFIKEDDFRTVVTKRKRVYQTKKNYESLTTFKERSLLNILEVGGKTLIYTSSHKNVSQVCSLLTNKIEDSDAQLCMDFAEWLAANYGPNCYLIPLVQRAIGVHNGNLHRSLAQIQIKLFEEEKGISTLVSTSSIIEGVNTQAEKVVLWNNKIGSSKLDYFTYRNIIGRAGRMLKYFVGYVYLLEEEPAEEKTHLELPLNDEVICSLEEENPGIVLNLNQKHKLADFNVKLQQILGKSVVKKLRANSALKGATPSLVLKLAEKIKNNPNWPTGYEELTKNNTFNWRTPISQMLEVAYGKNSAGKINLGLWAFSFNWKKGLIYAAQILTSHGVDEKEIFSIERDVNFKVPMVLSVVHAIKSELFPGSPDIRAFIANASSVFLPKNVFILEEYGLPRMISKKIHEQGLMDLENDETPIQNIITAFKEIGEANLIERLNGIHTFDKYIIHYFYNGI